MLVDKRGLKKEIGMSEVWIMRQAREDPHFPVVRCGRSLRFEIDAVISYLKSRSQKNGNGKEQQ
jgi:hypothetical protein